MRGFEPDRRRLLKTASGAVLGLTTLSGNVSGLSSNRPTAAAATDAETTVTYDVNTLPEKDDLVELTITLTGPSSLSEAVEPAGEEFQWLLFFGTDYQETNADGISNELGGGGNDAAFRWDRETLPAMVTIRYQAFDPTHRLANNVWVADDWALLSIDSSFPETVSVAESVSGEAERAGSITFVGSHQTYERSGHKETIRLVVPQVADLSETRSTVLDALSYQVRHLRVGNRTAEHTIIAAPEEVTHSYAVGDHAVVSSWSGIQENNWGHEYVHTRQRAWLTSSTEWLTEAEPSYYAMLLAYKRGDVDWDGGEYSFQEVLNINESAYDDKQLTDPDAGGLTPYQKGMRVVAALDARIRTHTDGDRTYQDVLRLLNRRHTRDAPDPLDHEAYVTLLEEVAGTSMTEFADRYIDGTEIPPVPADQSLYTRGETDFDVDYSTAFEYPDSSPPSPGELVMVQATLETTGTDPSVGPTVEIDGPEGWTFQNASLELQLPEGAPDHTETPSWTAGDEARYTTAEFAPGDRLEISALFQVADSQPLTGEETVALSVTDDDENATTMSTTLADHFLYAALDLPDEGVVGSPTTLDASVTPTPAGTEITSYTFSFDGQQPTTDEPTITHTFDAVGTYDVSVTVETADGQTDTATESLTVVEDDGNSGGTTTTDDGNSGGGGDGTTTTDDGDGGCFITTATANEAATLNSLRRFRDESMSVTPLGRALVGLYYRLSPPIADTLERNPDSRTAGWTRAIVNRCATLSNTQERTDSTVRSASLGVVLTILYVVGVFVAATGHAAIRASERRG